MFKELQMQLANQASQLALAANLALAHFKPLFHFWLQKTKMATAKMQTGGFKMEQNTFQELVCPKVNSGSKNKMSLMKTGLKCLLFLLNQSNTKQMTYLCSSQKNDAIKL